MDASESNPSPPAAAGQIPSPSFRTIRHGYDPAQVLEYVKRLTDHLLGLESEVRRLQEELRAREAAAETTPTRTDPYEGVAARVADLVKTFDQDVERLRRDTQTEASKLVAEAKVEAERVRGETQRMRRHAEAEADVILSQARSEADRIRHEAQTGAEEARIQAAELLRDARMEAAEVLAGLASRDAIIGELKSTRDQVMGILSDLEATLGGVAPTPDVVVVETAEA